MAFPSGLRQTAENAASQLVASFVTAGLVTDTDEARKLVGAVADERFAVLQEAAKDDPPFEPKGSSKGGSGGRKGGSGGGGGSSITVEDARSTKMKYGAFGPNEESGTEGLTLGAIFKMDADECANYGYGDDETPKTGRDYIKWLASDSQAEKNAFLHRRAKLIIEAARSETDE